MCLWGFSALSFRPHLKTSAACRLLRDVCHTDNYLSYLGCIGRYCSPAGLLLLLVHPLLPSRPVEQRPRLSLYRSLHNAQNHEEIAQDGRLCHAEDLPDCVADRGPPCDPLRRLHYVLVATRLHRLLLEGVVLGRCRAVWLGSVLNRVGVRSEIVFTGRLFAHFSSAIIGPT